MARLFRKLVFWAVILLIVQHSLMMVERLLKSLGTSTQVAVTVTNLQRIDAALQREHLMEGVYPSDFQVFMDQSFRGDAGRILLDTWKRPFRYERRPGGYALYSSGPDGTAGTADDMSITREGDRVATRLAARQDTTARPASQEPTMWNRTKWTCVKYGRIVRYEWQRLRYEVRKARDEKRRTRGYG